MNNLLEAKMNVNIVTCETIKEERDLDLLLSIIKRSMSCNYRFSTQEEIMWFHIVEPLTITELHMLNVWVCDRLYCISMNKLDMCA